LRHIGAIAALTFSLQFLLIVFARPMMAQSADNAHAKAEAPSWFSFPVRLSIFGKVIWSDFDGPCGVAIASTGVARVTNSMDKTNSAFHNNGTLIGNFHPTARNFNSPGEVIDGLFY
jgi:hypothetical protein